MRINSGTPGIGVPSLMTKLLDSNQMDTTTLKITNLDQRHTTMAFKANELDASLFALAPG